MARLFIQLCLYLVIWDTAKYPFFFSFASGNALKYPRRIRQTLFAAQKASKVGLCPTSACSFSFARKGLLFPPCRNHLSLTGRWPG